MGSNIGPEAIDREFSPKKMSKSGLIKTRCVKENLNGNTLTTKNRIAYALPVIQIT